MAILTWIKTNKAIQALKDTFKEIRLVNGIVSILILMCLLVTNHFLSDATLIEVLTDFFQLYITLFSILFSYIFALKLVKGETSVALLSTIIIIGVSVFLLTENYYMEMILIAPLLTLGNCYLLQGFRSFTYGTRNLPKEISNDIRNFVAFVIVSSALFLIFASVPNVIIDLTSKIRYIISYLASFWALLIIVLILIWAKFNEVFSEITAIIKPVWIYMFFMNVMLLLTGTNSVYVGSEMLVLSYLCIGGFGNTLGLSLALCLFTKDPTLKNMRRNVLKESVFNQNSLIFNEVLIPYKTYFMIPVSIVTVLSTCIAFFAISLNYSSIPIFVILEIFSFIFIPFLSTNLAINSILLSVGTIILSFAIYAPFLIRFDRALNEQ